jgi:hypothetical protein
MLRLSIATSQRPIMLFPFLDFREAIGRILEQACQKTQNPPAMTLAVGKNSLKLDQT